MNVTLTKVLNEKVKTITGQLIQNGITYITLVITNKNGSRSIKQFKKADYMIKIHKSN